MYFYREKPHFIRPDLNWCQVHSLDGTSSGLPELQCQKNLESSKIVLKTLETNKNLLAYNVAPTTEKQQKNMPLLAS